MNKKLSRNELCPCGSGKKYKKCCLVSSASTSQSADIMDFSWRKLRQLEGAVFDKHLVPYVLQELPKETLMHAMHDCFAEELPESVERELVFENFFLPWYIFNWLPGEDYGVKGLKADVPLAQSYVYSHEQRLNSQERRFIEAMLKTYYSLYTVLEVKLNESLLVKDLLLETTHTIKERQGTHQLKRGDIVYGRILSLDAQSIFVGMAPMLLGLNYRFAPNPYFA